MLSDVANKIFKSKYASNSNETWEEACWRVSSYIASIDDDSLESAKEYFQLIYNKMFLPGGRILSNSGTDIKNLMNCFALPIGDSRNSIYETLQNAAEIFACGGGVGYNFSDIRERGALIVGTGGEASGPLSFMSLFDQTGEVMQQASRRGAQIAILNVDHPDIEEFIDFKSTLNKRNRRIVDNVGQMAVSSKAKLEKALKDDQLTHFNISVGITDKFMNAVIADEPWELKSVVTGDVVKIVYARDILNKLALRAWESGDPGVLFLDRINEDNMVPYYSKIEKVNPCGEVPLLDGESCCLGSLNLMSFYDLENKTINFELMEHAVRTAVRFLDNVQSLSETPVPKVNEISQELRRLGLGIMGWADLLAELEVPYGGQVSLNLAEYISWFVSFFAWLESIELAEKRGEFPLFDPDRVDRVVLERIFTSKFVEHKFDFENMKVRNVSVTSIAPTGTIAIIAGVNSSIEPFYALSYKRYVTDGIGNNIKDTITELNPILFRKLKELDFSDGDIKIVKKYIKDNGTLVGCPKISERLMLAFNTAHDIPWQSHIDMQSAFQKYVTNGVSKTINCPNGITVEEIAKIFIEMWRKNIKGGTVYRDGSRTFQILNKK